jgi:pyruvate/2-oxoglutarate dehydrogenase complex dihydrolipoamide dehydrogenase (E3) component
VWALGDVKGGPAFTHISYNDYQIIWANLIEGKNASITNRIVPIRSSPIRNWVQSA